MFDKKTIVQKAKKTKEELQAEHFAQLREIQKEKDIAEMQMAIANPEGYAVYKQKQKEQDKQRVTNLFKYFAILVLLVLLGMIFL